MKKNWQRWERVSLMCRHMLRIFFTSIARPTKANRHMRSVSKATLSLRITWVSSCSLIATITLQQHSTSNSRSFLNSDSEHLSGQVTIRSSKAAPKRPLIIIFCLKKLKLLLTAQLSSTRRLVKGLFYSKTDKTSTSMLLYLWSKMSYFSQRSLLQ